MSKRMSYRQSAAARKRIKELEEKLRAFQSVLGTTITEAESGATICSEAVFGIRIAQKLGYVCVLESLAITGNRLRVVAVRKVDV